jgi:hypothetical protein
MSLVGGGGAPNVGGGSAAGVGTSLNYVGNHAYAHSGLIASATSEATQLKFATGNEYMVVTLMLNGGVDPANIGAGINTIFYIIMNGEKISTVKTETNLEDMPSTTLYKVLIPPQTRFEVTADSDFTGYQTSVTMTGRVYA